MNHLKHSSLRYLAIVLTDYPFQICMKKSVDEFSRKKNILKQFMKYFGIEERLKLFHYSSSTNQVRFSKILRFSLYSEACEYVKELQREEIDFSAKIHTLRDQSLQQYNDLVNQQNTSGYGQDSSGKADIELKKDLRELKNDMNQQRNELKNDKNDLKNDIKELKNDKNDLKEDMNELKKDINELKKDNHDLKKGIMDLKKCIENLSNQIQKS